MAFFPPGVGLARHRLQLSANTYLLKKNSVCTMVDPGLTDLVYYYLEWVKDCRRLVIMHTHYHYDHIAATPILRKTLEESMPVYVAHSKKGKNVLETGDAQYTLSHVFGEFLEPIKVDYLLEEGEFVIEGLKFRILETPGHTPDSITIIFDNVIFTGDLLFSDGSVGRWDLPGGNIRELYFSLHKLLSFKRGVLAPGHGDVFYGNIEELVERALLNII